MIAVLVSTVMICITLLICKKIQTNAYERVHNADLEWKRAQYLNENPSYAAGPGRRSPYKLKRVMHKESQKWGYTIAYRDTDKNYTSSDGYYQILSIEKARNVLREMEIGEGYIPTEFNE